MLRLVALVTIVAAAASPAFAQSGDARFVFPGQEPATKPRGPVATSPADEALAADAADGRLDRVPLLEAAMTAGGIVDPRAQETYRRRFEHWVAELQVSGRMTGAERDKARALLEYLHDRVLTGGFRDTSTSLDEAFEHGRFNCISSVILYRSLGERFALAIHGVETPGHAYAVVESPSGPIVVQTTCRGWFAAADDAATQRDLLRRTIGEAAAATSEAALEQRKLDDVGLVAVVYYNRGVDLLEAGRFEEAVAANEAALELDARNSAARANLLAAVNNWSLEVGRRGDLAQALQLLEIGLTYAPEYGLFHENLVALHQQRLAKAVTIEESAPQTKALRDAYTRWSRELQRRGASDEAQQVVRRAADDPFLRNVP